jgi:hypothetical protein
MELYVTCGSAQPPDAVAIGKRVQSHGLDLLLSPIDWPTQSGFLEMSLNGQPAGVEIYLDVSDDANEILAAFGQPLGQRVVAFRWSSSTSDCVCALTVAGAIAELIAGVILEPDSGKLMTPAAAFAEAKDLAVELG